MKHVLDSFFGFMWTVMLFILLRCFLTLHICDLQVNLYCMCAFDFVYDVLFPLCLALASVCMYVCAYLSVPSEVCSQLWVGVSQTAKRPTGKFPISTWCSVQCRLTTEGSEIQSQYNTAFSLSLSLSPNILSLALSPQMNRSRDEKLSGMLADRQCFTVI